MDLNLVRTSERTTHFRCAQKWYWSYVEGLKPIRKTVPLEFGTLVHQALAAYYKPGKKRGRHPAEVFLELYDDRCGEVEGQIVNQEAWDEAFSLGMAMLHGYVRKYGQDARYRVVAPEQAFQIDVDDPHTGRYLCTYVGTFDALVEDLQTGEYGLLEHKTAASIDLDRYEYDEQPNSYYAFAPDWLRSKGIIKKNQTLDFILINVLRKGFPDDRPKNKEGHALNRDGTVSLRQPAPLFARTRVYRDDAARRATMLRVINQTKVMRAQRRGKIPIYKSILNGCVGQYGCEFKDMCMMHEIESDWQALRDATMEHWDQYEDHAEMEGLVG